MVTDPTTPLVSIIMATYNGELYLEDQLISLVNQTYTPIEIIIVDDGSIDSSPEIIRKYQKKYPHIRAYFNEENLGYVKNFEKGAQLSAGEYISFSDQDDVWNLKKTEILMREIGSGPLIFCDDLMVDKNMKSLGHRQSDLVQLKSVNNSLFFVLDNVVGGHALIMTRALLLKAVPFPKHIPHDLWCAYTACFYGGVQYWDQVLVFWRQHSHAVTKIKKPKSQRKEETKARLWEFYNYCPYTFPQEKKVMHDLIRSYQNFSLKNNLLRSYLFFRYQKYLLGFKKRTPFRKFLFCLKMFFQVRLHVA